MNKGDVVEYFDRAAPGWDSNMVTDDAKIGFILNAAGVRENTSVLDVACGTGVLFPYYINRGVSRVLGVDISPEMVRAAKGKALDPRIQVICGDMEELPVSGLFDCCVIYNAFPHFLCPKTLIARLYHWIKPGGSLTVAHGMSLAALRRHHGGGAAAISREMLDADSLSALMRPMFRITAAVSDDEKYVVSGVKR